MRTRPTTSIRGGKVISAYPSAQLRFDSPEFQSLKAAVIERSGLAYYSDKNSSLARAVCKRIQLCGDIDLADYLDRLLSSDDEEWNALIETITIGETYFFRYPAHFDALRDYVVADCLNERGPLRVWSAGCSNGAEAYSVSILFRRDLRASIGDRGYSILGTDICHSSLHAAEIANYSDWDLRGVDERFRLEYFQRIGRRWQLQDEFKQGVRFRHQNLVDADSPLWDTTESAFDIIFCRNVLIYFDMDTCRRLLLRLHTCLRPGGWLIVGHAESYLEISRTFEPVQFDGATLYRRSTPGISAGPRSRTRSQNHSNSLDISPAISPNIRAPVWQPSPLPTVAPQGDTPAGPAIEDPGERKRVLLSELRRLADSGCWADAERRCDELLETYPLDAEVHYLSGLIQEQQGARDAAESMLKRALYLDSDFALAHFHLGMLNAARSDIDAAERCLRNVADLIEEHEGEEPVYCGDGLTIAELAELVRIHRESMRMRR